MELLEASLRLNNNIASKYIDGDKEITSLFDYQNVNDQKTFSERSIELTTRKFPREELVAYLLDFHKRYKADEATYNNIYRMKDPRSVVVIGGQQAGLLTGPLYTIHKIISIIKLAKEQEQLLNIPVIPIFWIAGEDHDFNEINHAFVSKDEKVEKRTIAQKHYKKSPVSTIKINKKIAEEWIKEIIGTYGETVHTNSLLEQLFIDLNQSDTYVDFFIRIILRLFPNKGLVLVDSGDEGLRKIGSPFTELIIRQNAELGENVLCGQMSLKEMGYGEPIEMNEENAHLFYLQKGERILLERSNGHFIGKNKECHFDQASLINIARNEPYLLSNNVVTRPLMQEYVFPTLAFISGPGEIAYWSVLKKAFHLFGFKVPPVIPRLMISFVDRKVNQYIKEKGISIELVLKDGASHAKQEWLWEQKPFDIDKVTEETLTGILNVHRPFKELAIEIDPGLQAFAEKNAQILQTQIYLLKQKMEKSILFKNQVELNKFDCIDLCLRPLNTSQERIWNIFYYINLFGFDFIKELIELDFKWNGHHKVVYI